MLCIYDLGMRIGRRAVLATARMARGAKPSKFVRFAQGQRSVITEARKVAASLPGDRPTVWIHASSLGEFGIARPIIRLLKGECDCNVVVTFFSPTGYEALNPRRPDGVDAVLYFPFDTKPNIRTFLDSLRPACAVFMVSEFWPNCLHELHKRSIPTYLVSAVIRPDSPFFKWYGSLFRRSIGCFTKIFTLNEESCTRLEQLGQKDVTVNGDPLFDNVSLVAATKWEDVIVGRFTDGRKVFIAGSLHDDQDLELVTTLANRHPDTRFIIVPHEIDTAIIRHLEEKINGKTVCYSKCSHVTDFADTQVLVIDFVGALAYIYRYATWAYVGGGFTRLLHSVIEPAVYGLPVAFGPNVNRKPVTLQMIELGIGCVTATPDALDRWFCGLKDNPGRLREIAEKSAIYVNRNIGAAARVVNQIRKDICVKN